MARVINRKAGNVHEKYNEAVSGASSIVTQGPVNKAWRARILTNRALSGLPKTGSLTPNLTKTINSITSGNIVSDAVSSLTGIKPGPSAKIVRAEREKSIAQGEQLGAPIYRGNQIRQVDPTQAAHPTLTMDYLSSKEEWEAMYDEGIVTSNKVIIFNNSVSPYQYIELQNRPTQIDFMGESTWAVIKSMGRNTPMYHYTSAEEIIQMNISWYCNDPKNPGEVINKCRLLESWTKADGYTLAPPVLQIGWGSDGDLFYGRYFILASATYALNNFNSGYRMRNRSSVDIPTQNTYLLPYTATQELIFKRVADHNLTHSEMTTLGMGNRFTLQETQGITYSNNQIGYLRT